MTDVISGMFLAACYLRYMDALKLGDNFASRTSLAAFEVARLHIAPAHLDLMARRWGLENPAGLDPAGLDRDRRILEAST